MNEDSVKGNKQLSGKIKDKWGKKRTDNDLGKAGSHKEQGIACSASHRRSTTVRSGTRARLIRG